MFQRDMIKNKDVLRGGFYLLLCISPSVIIVTEYFPGGNFKKPSSLKQHATKIDAQIVCADMPMFLCSQFASNYTFRLERYLNPLKLCIVQSKKNHLQSNTVLKYK